MKIAMMALLLVASTVHAHEAPLESFTSKQILADLKDLRALNIPVLVQDEQAGVGYTVINPEMQQRIQNYAHSIGKCGGFEDVSQEIVPQSTGFAGILKNLAGLRQKDALYDRAPFRTFTADKNPVLEAAVAEVSEENITNTVKWLSSYPTRFNKGDQANVHVLEMKKRLEAMMASAKVPYEISLIDHTSTEQKTIRVRLPGSAKPNEIVVLGGHLDSINVSWFGGKLAPGADDNASGSADLMEALRIASQKTQSQRTIEFFWYAGEESGLLGSAEIAKQYKADKKEVIAVLQLDMTLFPGDGEFVVGSMTDFTSSWLRDYFKSMNDLYIHGRVVDSECGYGCSDHASWYRQGYPTLMPFEATMQGMNPNIHTAKDVISPQSDFKHATMYGKIATVFALDLGNSTIHQPY